MAAVSGTTYGLAAGGSSSGRFQAVMSNGLSICLAAGCFGWIFFCAFMRHSTPIATSIACMPSRKERRWSSCCVSSFQHSINFGCDWKACSATLSAASFPEKHHRSAGDMLGLICWWLATLKTPRQYGAASLNSAATALIRSWFGPLAPHTRFGSSKRDLNSEKTLWLSVQMQNLCLLMAAACKAAAAAVSSDLTTVWCLPGRRPEATASKLQRSDLLVQTTPQLQILATLSLGRRQLPSVK